eukprot:GHRR01012601.1.p2 GENE.GHRR01012601.1~~GHRR01012601.1.p2  ORF type:complete len:101 (+),score=20.84 GHRR01012601.1:13-315(+)
MHALCLVLVFTLVIQFVSLAACFLPALNTQTVLKFIRRTCDMSNDFDMWGSGFNSWQDMLWRRSALQYLMDMQLGPEAGVCFSVMERLARWVCVLNRRCD